MIEKDKELTKVIIMVTVQNIVTTVLWIILAITFEKWWIGLFSFFTYKSITYKKGE